MLDLVVKCEKAREGCEWEGEIRSLDQHKSTCLHVPVPCPRECDVGSVLRGDLQSHLRDYCSQRDYECPHCLQMGRYRECVTSHLQDCPMVLTECPNEGCEEMLCSSLILLHVADCPLTVLQCRYSEVGCKVQLPRRDLEEHEQHDRLHLQVATKKIAALQNEMDKLTKHSHNKIIALQSGITQLTAALQNTLKDNLLTFKITDCKKKSDLNPVFYSPPFYTSSEGYRMKIIVDINGVGDGEGTHISVYVRLMRGDYDEKLNWPFIGEVTITLLNQLEDAGHYKRTIDITSEINLLVGTGWGNPCFIHRRALRYNQTNYTQYLKDNTLYFRVSVWTSDNKPWLHCTA